MDHATMLQYQQNWQWTTLLKYDMPAAKPTAHPRVSRTSNLQVTYLTIFRITERQEVRAPQLAATRHGIIGQLHRDQDLRCPCAEDTPQ